MDAAGKLYVVGTPIGNLEDATLRALRVLKEADAVLCEDTRVTRKLLAHYDISKDLISYHQHSKLTKVEKILELLEDGKTLALVTDAGTPGISDPGALLVSRVRDKLPAVYIEAVPGPSALTAALSVAGMPIADFVFFGFLPHKKGREKLFAEIAETNRAVILYESPHRLRKTLESLAAHLSDKRMVAVVRELTKIHESVREGSARELADHYADNPAEVRGEIVVLIAPERSGAV